MKNDLKLKQILNLVGKLDDKIEEGTSRERFRQYLEENVRKVGLHRTYVKECLNNSGDQYNKALQDLVNHLGILMGFEVEFGLYRGKSGQNGFDGHWKSPLDFDIVVETKTTEVYAIKTSTLLGYINGLVSNRKIQDSKKVLGLYIIGRQDPELNQLENTIIVEKPVISLRIISIESLLSLAELMRDYDLKHKDILETLCPSGPTINKLVNLLSKVVDSKNKNEQVEIIEENKVAGPDIKYWMTPVSADGRRSAEETIKFLVVKNREYAFSDRTPGRKYIKKGDRICFYASGNGVVADARLSSELEKKVNPNLTNPDDYPWTFELDKIKSYFDNPIIITEELRKKMDQFKGRDMKKAWSWFVFGTKSISEHDFNLLTGR